MTHLIEPLIEIFNTIIYMPLWVCFIVIIVFLYAGSYCGYQHAKDKFKEERRF